MCGADTLLFLCGSKGRRQAAGSCGLAARAAQNRAMKRYLITGASRGIGRAIAEKLATSQTTLLLHGRDRDALKETSRLAEAKGARTTLLLYELNDQSQIEKMIATIGRNRLMH